MKNQYNSRLLASLSFLHSCPKLDRITRQSYLMHPESIPSAFSACGHQLFRRLQQQLFKNPGLILSPHMLRPEDLWVCEPKQDAGASGWNPEALIVECVGFMWLCPHHTFIKMERWTKDQCSWDPFQDLSIQKSQAIYSSALSSFCIYWTFLLIY